MKKKILIISGIVIAVICIAVIVALICQPGDSEGYEGVLENNELEENKQNAPIVPPDGSAITNNTEKEETNPIPDIKEPQVTVNPNDKSEIDVEEMTRNPEAEVVGGEIEYGTKEDE